MEEKPAGPADPLAPVPTAQKSPIWTIIIIVLVALVLAVSAFIAYQLGKQQKTPSPTGPTSPVAPPVSTTPTLKRIAYAKDHSLWVINADGSEKKTLVGAVPTNNYFADGAWKDKDHFSFVKCANVSCAIYTQSVIGGSQVTENTPTGLRIATLAWNHAGTQLAYIFSPVDGQMQLDFNSQGTESLVKKFTPAAGGRGGSLDDNISIYFSPDDKHVLVTNTGTQPNSADKNTIWVFESGGKEIVSLSGSAGWATQARWADNNRVVYKMGGTVYAYYLDGTPTQKLMSEKSLQNPVPFGQQLYFWVNEDLPRIGAGQELVGYYRPDILDATHLVALKAKKLPPEEALLMTFTTAGLSSIDLTTNKATDLDSGDVTFFSVSP